MNEFKIKHANIYVGIDHDLMFNYCLELSKKILCLEQNSICSNYCRSCNLIDLGNHPDLFFLTPESDKKFISIDNARRAKSWSMLTPIISNYKVLIINNINLMPVGASNAMLKLLEEPAEYLTILITASDLNQILPTIISRSCVWRLNENNSLIKNIKSYDYEHELNMLINHEKSAIAIANQLKSLPIIQTIDAIYLWLSSLLKNEQPVKFDVLEVMKSLLDHKKLIKQGITLNNQLLLESVLLELTVLDQD